MSEGEGRSGNLVEAYQIRARICLLNGDKQAAREQLNMALTVAHDAAMKRKIRSKIVRLRKENFLE